MRDLERVDELYDSIREFPNSKRKKLTREITFAIKVMNDADKCIMLVRSTNTDFFHFPGKQMSIGLF